MRAERVFSVGRHLYGSYDTSSSCLQHGRCLKLLDMSRSHLRAGEGSPVKGSRKGDKSMGSSRAGEGEGQGGGGGGAALGTSASCCG